MTAKPYITDEVATLFPPSADTTRFLIGCKHGDYSASAIARAVEDCNAHVLNLNVTAIDCPGADTVVDLRVGSRAVAAIARSLERYGYTVLQAGDDDRPDEHDDNARRRAQELLRYIDI